MTLTPDDRAWVTSIIRQFIYESQTTQQQKTECNAIKAKKYDELQLSYTNQNEEVRILREKANKYDELQSKFPCNLYELERLKKILDHYRA